MSQSARASRITRWGQNSSSNEHLTQSSDALICTGQGNDCLTSPDHLQSMLLRPCREMTNLISLLVCLPLLTKWRDPRRFGGRSPALMSRSQPHRLWLRCMNLLPFMCQVSSIRRMRDRRRVFYPRGRRHRPTTGTTSLQLAGELEWRGIWTSTWRRGSSTAQR